MHIFLLILYVALAAYAIWKVPFLRNSGIRQNWLWLLFGLHVVAGWAHNWIAYRFFPEHGDIWNYLTLSFLYRHRLVSEFHLFLCDNSTWTYITHNGIVYVQMLLDLLSGDDMTINTFLFAFPVFLGNVALYRVFRRRFPNDSLAATAVFWLPSVLFWTACIYREGMLFMLLGFLFYHLDRFFSCAPDPNLIIPQPVPPSPNPTSSRRPLFYAIALFLLIAYFRLAVAVILVPAMLVWWWMEHPLPRAKRPLLAAAVIILMVLVLSLPALHDPILRAATTEQASFMELEGHSRLPLPALNGTFAGVWRALPAAVRNGFFEPLPGSGGQPLYLCFSIELIFIWLIAVLAISRIFKPDHSAPLVTTSFSAACLTFALAGMLTIGFIVPFAGTIVRYRSIYLPFFLAPTLHLLRDLPVIKSLNRRLDNKL